jgi:leucyl-tRNA synthetase
MRYTCPDADTMVDGRNDYWMPMDQYIGGIEHAILHLLYARFWTKVMRDLKLVKVDEPFTRLLTQGMVLNHIFERRGEKSGIEYFAPDEVNIERDVVGKIIGATAKSDGKPVNYAGIGTMSKSKRNGIDPQDMFDRYGADTVRLFIMFASHPEATLEWSDAGVEGSNRFLRRLWGFATDTKIDVHAKTDFANADKAVKKARFELHTSLKQANFDYERIQYNTVVSAAMKMLNTLEGFDGDGVPAEQRIAFHTEGLSLLLRVLYPIVPHTTYVLWEKLKFHEVYGSLLDAPWCDVDEAALKQDEIELVLQVNGKLRGKLMVAADASRDTIENAARDSAEVARFADGKPIKKIVVVPGRLVNVVI